ncbi:MAG: O-antigen ligase family protein, partial [Clostridia bacterium]|nr:O-antigen ligase family protein [Clostridia bacterium]
KRSAKRKFNKKLIPVFLMMVIPLIMYYQLIPYDTVKTYPYYASTTGYADLFAYYKTIAIYVTAILSIIFYFLYTRKRDMELRRERFKYYIPAAIYAFFIVLSAIFSIFPKVAIFGVYERWEGALVLISYLIFMIYIIEVIRDKRDMDIVMTAFLFMVVIVSGIGVFQFYVVDIFKIRFFQWLIGIPEGALVDSHFDNWAYSTLYNPNNLGQFAALTTPVTAGIFFAFKSIKGKVFAGITCILSFLAGLGSTSANFIAGIAFAALLFFILFAAHLIPKNKKARIAVFILAGLFVITLIALSGRIWNRVKRTSFVQNEIESIKPESDDIYFNDIIVTDDVISFVTTKGTFYLRYTDRGIMFYDTEMNFLDFEQNGNQIRFTEEPYRTQWAVRIKSTNTLDVLAKRAYSYARVEVVFDETKFLGIRGTGDRILHELVQNQMPERFRGLETAASRRGYLWIVTASRLDEVFFIGAGPDTFLYWFEQNDVIGKANFLHTTSILADKPHNWYLQVASQTGVISLIALLALTGIYIVSTLRLIGVRRKKDYYEFIASGILCGVIGFMVSSLFVDSTVGVTPMFFIMLGIGILSNEYIKRQISVKTTKNGKK